MQQLDLGDCWLHVAEYLTSFRDLSSLMLVNSKSSLSVGHLDKYWNTKIEKLKGTALIKHELLNGLEVKIQQLESGKAWKNRRQLLVAMINQIRQELNQALELKTKSMFGNYEVEFLDRRKIPPLSDELKSTPRTIKVSFAYSNFMLDLLLFRREVDVEALILESSSTFQYNENLSIHFESKFQKKSNLVIIPFHGYPMDLDKIDELNNTIPRVLVLTMNRMAHQKALWAKTLSPDLIELFSDENIAQLSKSIGAFTFLEATDNINSIRNLLLEYISKIYGYCSQNTMTITKTSIRTPFIKLEQHNNEETSSSTTKAKHRKSKECIIS